MGSPLDHEIRSREIADSLRNFLLTVNSGAIALLFTVAGLMEKGGGLTWVRIPAALFVIGLFTCAGSMFLAQSRELKRRDAAKGKTSEPKFPFYQTSVFWNSFSFLSFVSGVVVAFVSLSCVGSGV